MMGVSEEELYSIPTAEYVHRRAFLNRQLTVYHAAFHAAADLQNTEVFFILPIIVDKLIECLCICYWIVLVHVSLQNAHGWLFTYWFFFKLS